MAPCSSSMKRFFSDFACPLMETISSWLPDCSLESTPLPGGVADFLSTNRDSLPQSRTNLPYLRRALGDSGGGVICLSVFRLLMVLLCSAVCSSLCERACQCVGSCVLTFLEQLWRSPIRCLPCRRRGSPCASRSPPASADMWRMPSEDMRATDVLRRCCRTSFVVRRRCERSEAASFRRRRVLLVDRAPHLNEISRLA